MNAKQLLHQEKLNKWTAMFHEQHESGLSVKDWCTQNNVSPYAFFYWKRVAKENYMQSPSPSSVWPYNPNFRIILSHSTFIIGLIEIITLVSICHFNNGINQRTYIYIARCIRK